MSYNKIDTLIITPKLHFEKWVYIIFHLNILVFLGLKKDTGTMSGIYVTFQQITI